MDVVDGRDEPGHDVGGVTGPPSRESARNPG
jgi:hypothetical protein